MLSNKHANACAGMRLVSTDQGSPLVSCRHAGVTQHSTQGFLCATTHGTLGHTTRNQLDAQNEPPAPRGIYPTQWDTNGRFRSRTA